MLDVEERQKKAQERARLNAERVEKGLPPLPPGKEVEKEKEKVEQPPKPEPVKQEEPIQVTVAIKQAPQPEPPIQTIAQPVVQQETKTVDVAA